VKHIRKHRWRVGGGLMVEGWVKSLSSKKNPKIFFHTTFFYTTLHLYPFYGIEIGNLPIYYITIEGGGFDSNPPPTLHL